MSKRRSKTDTNRKAVAAADAPRTTSTIRRWALGCLTVLVVSLLLLLLVLPSIITRTVARDYLLARLLPADSVVVSLQDLSMGWFAPLEIKGLRVLDAAGKPLAEFQRVAGNRTILQLLQDQHDLGQLIIEQPVLHLSLRPEGSNLEDTLTRLMPQQTTDAKQQLPAITLKVKDAQVIATSESTGEQWTIDQLNIDAEAPTSQSAKWTCSLDGQLNGQRFSLSGSTPLGLATDTWPLGPTGSATAHAEKVPLTLFQYFATRCGQGVERLAGTLTVDGEASWQAADNVALATRPVINVTGNLAAQDVELVSESLLGTDVLRCSSATLSTQVQLKPDAVTIELCEFDSDFGSASARTTLGESLPVDYQTLLRSIRGLELTSQGEVDMAAIAKALPNTLRIQDNVEVSSGTVRWDVTSKKLAEVTAWTGNIRTEDIQVLRSGRSLDWNFPLEIDFAVSDGEEVEVEQFLAKSDFFSLSGHGKLRQGSFQAEANLEQFIYQLSQVADLGAIYVRGDMRSTVQWRESEPNRVQLDARTKLTQFVMTQSEQVLCREDELTTLAKGVATLDGQTVAALEEARLDLVSAGDFLVAELQESVSRPGPQSSWPVTCRVKGSLERWFARLKLFGVGQAWQVTGTIDATSQLRGNSQGATIEALVANVESLSASSEGVRIVEPVIQIKSAGSVDFDPPACRLPQTTIVSQSFSARADAIAINFAPHLVMSGDIGYQARVERLLEYLPSQRSSHISGLARGRVMLQATPQSTNFDLIGEIENLRVDQANPQLPLHEELTPLWHEPKLTLRANGTYEAAADKLELEQAEIGGKVIYLSAQGAASALTTTPTVEMGGEYGYDLDGLSAIFRDVLGPNIRLTGSPRQQFAIQGPAFSIGGEEADFPDLSAEFGVGWDTAHIYGVPLGPLQVDAKLADGILQVSPLNVAVGEGRAYLSPTIDLKDDRMLLRLQPQQIAEQIRISPEMTGTWMKYIAPLLADATSAEGTFSLNLEQAEVPLVDPTAGRIQGELVIHGGILGPGPMATQFIQLATEIKQITGRGRSSVMDPTKAWVRLEPQQIAFEMAHGRVYHQGLAMQVDDVLIRTRGSVGVTDDSLTVLAEVPIRDDWVADSTALAGLRGHVISIPISGTTTQPQFDQRALAQVTRQLASRAAAGYIQQELGDKIQQKLGNKLQDVLGGENGSPDLGDQLQNEIGRQLNKLFK